MSCISCTITAATTGKFTATACKTCTVTAGSTTVTKCTLCSSIAIPVYDYNASKTKTTLWGCLLIAVEADRTAAAFWNVGKCTEAITTVANASIVIAGTTNPQWFCLTCNDGYVTTVTAGVSDGECIACNDGSCKTCTTSSAAACTVCNDGKALATGACAGSCSSTGC